MTVTVGDETFQLSDYSANLNWANNLDVFTGKYFAQALNISYDLRIEQGKLVLSLPSMTSVQLDPRITDLFTGDRSHFSSLAFQRDSNGIVTGFKLATTGVADIWFQKEILQNGNLQEIK